MLMIVGLVLAVLVVDGGGHPVAPSYQGVLAHYSPEVMESVSAARALPVVPCMAVSPFHPLGSWVRITRVGTTRTRICRVTDVAAPQDAARLRAGRIFEVDFHSAQVLCQIRRVGEEPPAACPVDVRAVFSASAGS